MARTLNNMKEFELYVASLMKDTIETDVVEKVKDVQQSNVQTEVYDRYKSTSDHPDAYVRRGEQGGLKDRKNIQVTNRSESSTGGNYQYDVDIENVTTEKHGNRRLDKIVEYGQEATGGYDYTYTRAGNQEDYLRPRKFIEKSVNELKSTGEHVKVFKDGMRKRGVKVE